MSSQHAKPDISVVIPLYNEEENIDPAVLELLDTLDGMPQSAEVILVDDGSRDSTGERALRWNTRDPRVKVIRFRRNFGQTSAIAAGFEHAQGQIVIVMDGDQQNDPSDIPLLLAKMAEGYDVVSGWRKQRKDKLLMRRLPSLLANKLISRITQTHLHDYGCTLKAYHSDVVRELNLYGELHRFIPALATQTGARVTEIPVKHRKRTRGTSKYGISRTTRVILDLMTVKFLLKYRTRPMQFFGLPGLASFFIGGVILAGLLVDRLVFHHGIADRPLLSAGILLAFLGLQFLAMGFLGEMLTRIYYEVGDHKPYTIRTRMGFDQDEEPFLVLGRGQTTSSELDIPVAGGRPSSTS
jgi:glycosyltransferase involved in cell wall biosynthesis